MSVSALNKPVKPYPTLVGKRRMELLGTVRGIEVYDDFAHHPTAIETTLDGARKRLGERKLGRSLNHVLTPCVWAAIKMVWHTLHV
jgi:hypothetical protein